MSEHRLPGGHDGRPNRPRIYTFNIVVTGRCNTACTYCHYYLARNRKSVAYDINEDQFDVYMSFVKLWSDSIEGHMAYRFSGGDPMVLGDRLFRLAESGFRQTSVRPFVLTAGKALDVKWAEKARSSPISHVFVSIENPIEPDPGAPNPFKVVRAIKECDSPEMPILPGVCVVPNHCFGKLYDICSWFYDELGRIPIISEVNYAAYKSPTGEQWAELEANLEKVVRAFHGKTPLNLFSSVSPELNYGTNDPYIFELDLENSYGMTPDNYREKLPIVIDKLTGSNYPRLLCPNRDCDWWEFCDNTKWFWQGDRNNSQVAKLSDYCRFKRLLNDSYYRVLIDADHRGNERGIDAVEYYQISGPER